MSSRSDSEIASVLPPESAGEMPLDLSFGDDDTSSDDVIVTMTVPPRHWKRNRRHVHPDIVVVGSDSEDEDDDIAIVSVTPTKDVNTEDCTIESYRPAISSSGGIVTIAPISDNVTAINGDDEDDDALRFGSCDLGLSDACANLRTVFMTNGSRFGSLTDPTSSLANCSTDRISQDMTSLVSCGEDTAVKFSLTPLHGQGILFDVRPKLSISISNPSFLTFDSISIDRPIQLTRNSPHAAVDDDRATVPIASSSQLSRNDYSITAFCDFSATADRTAPSDFSSNLDDAGIITHPREAVKYQTPVSGIFEPYSLPASTATKLDFCPQRDADTVTDEVAVSAETRLTSLKRRSADDLCPASPGSQPIIKSRRCPSPPPVSWSRSSAAKEKPDVHAKASHSSHTAQCCTCGSSEEIGRLSQCMAGHPCCGMCLQNRVKTLLAGSVKGAIMCKQPGCQAYYLATQLRNSLPDIVIEILQAKLDREYCDDVSRLATADILLPGSSSVSAGGDGCIPVPSSSTKPDDDGLTDLPKNWEKMSENEACRRVDLDSASLEYTWVKDSFHQTMSWQRVRILRIQRVQNHALWQFFIVKRRQMQRENCGPVTEKHLFHGTSHNTVDAICSNNFDWRLCGSHGTVYGQGSYFAVEASYSHTYTDCIAGRPRPILHSMPPGGLRLIERNVAVPSSRLFDPFSFFLSSNPGLHTMHRRLGNIGNSGLIPGFPQPAHQPKVPIFTAHIASHLQPAHQPSSAHHILHHSASSSLFPPSGHAATMIQGHSGQFQQPVPPITDVSGSNPSNGGAAVTTCCRLSVSSSQPPAHGGSSLLPSNHPAPLGQPQPSIGISACLCPNCSHQRRHFAPLPPYPQIAPPAHFRAATGFEQPGNPSALPPHHFMFLARVLVGRSALGRSEYRTPPPLDPSQPFGHCYDSCINRLINPSIFVVFNSAQCYPEYVIEYVDVTH